MGEPVFTDLSEEQVRAQILALSELADWPEAASLFAARNDGLRLDWQLPARACVAVGSQPEAALPAVAAVACLQISIILADDMLDQDPRGEYRRLGHGRAANLALAFQAAALTLLGTAPLPPERQAAASSALARAALATCFGQELDVSGLAGEDAYWRIVRAKSTPFYGVALQLGGLLGGADLPVAQGLYDLGALMGEVVQICDDLEDAFEVPANPDWGAGRNNLLILYAATAGHAERERFMAVRGQVETPSALEEAQQILIRSGALSYGVYQLLQRWQRGRHLLSELPLASSSPILEVFESQIRPLVRWLNAIGVALPPELTGGLA